MRIVVKIGTHSVLAEDGHSLHPAMADRVAEIATLKKQGHDVLLVSSGAVGMGLARIRRTLLEFERSSLAHTSYASTQGQAPLLAAWQAAFEPHQMRAGMILLQHRDFKSQHTLEILNQTLAIGSTDPNGITVFNENDGIANDELQGGKGFTDNDHLASLLAIHTKADMLILLTGTDGIMTANPAHDPDAKNIPYVFLDTTLPSFDGKSSGGRGGMASKTTSAFEAARHGVHPVIAHAHRPNVITSIVAGNDVGTRIVNMKSYEMSAFG